MTKWTVVCHNDFGYPIGETIDYEPIEEFKKFVDGCDINFNQIYFDTLYEFDQFHYWYLFNGIRCYDEPTFESIKDDYTTDFLMIWEGWDE